MDLLEQMQQHLKLLTEVRREVVKAAGQIHDKDKHREYYHVLTSQILQTQNLISLEKARRGLGG